MAVVTGLIVAGIAAGVGAGITGGTSLKIAEGQKDDIEKDFTLQSGQILKRAREDSFLLGRQADRATSSIRQQAGASGFEAGSFAAVEEEVTDLTIEQQERIIAGAETQVNALRRRSRNLKKAVRRQQLMTVAGIFAGQSQTAGSLVGSGLSQGS